MKLEDLEKIDAGITIEIKEDDKEEKERIKSEMVEALIFNFKNKK